MSRRTLLVLLAVLASANALVFLAKAFVFTPVLVRGTSMQPALDPGDRLLVNRRVSIDDIERGDIVAFSRSRGEDARPAIKRVIALPGEQLQMGGQVIAIDRDERLDEPYARWGDAQASVPPTTLEDDQLWVLGDNRPASTDSRDFGAISSDDVLGVAALRFWPLHEIGTLG